MRRLAIIVLAVLASCGGDDDAPPPGTLNGPCLPGGSCNAGLTCRDNYCQGDMVNEAGVVDAPPTDGGFVCADDSALEPNDTVANAFDTGVAGTASSRTFASLALCPAGDTDVYRITTSIGGQNVELVVDYAAEGTALDASLLNASGVAIVNATPVTATPRRLRAFAVNVPTGTYHARVYGQGTNNYQFTVTVSGP